MLSVARIVDRRVLWGLLVTSLCGLAVLTLAGPVPDATAAPSACGTPGSDGPQPTLGGIVNSYFPGTSPSVTAGATSLTVGASTGSSAPISVGDKVLIIQIQSAAVDSSNTDAYGDGIAGEPPGGATSWASAGVYEFSVAASNVSSAGGTLQLATGTVNAYASAAATASAGQQAFQVVRVPQYSSATLGSNVTATPWNGATGGIVALDVAGALDLNGFRIDVSATGFRGGAGRQLSGSAGGANTDVRTSAASAFNGGKAEGVAGTPRYVFDGTTTVDTGVEGYPSGSFARGAPANAGGGGTDGNPSANDQNSGGGGGANAGAGGQGGNTWSSNLAVGGAGGVTVPALGVTKVVLGGGGGGATRNNAGPSSGGVGAGLVILDVGSLTGTGEIRANGGDGQTAENDGGGGGGAGGTVVVAAAGGGLSGLTVSANGGDGGGAWPTQGPGGFPGARHGPGGGGGGGFVLLSTSGATTTTNGGMHGVTTTANDAYNATDGTGGSAGTYAGSLPGAGSASSCSPRLTVTKLTSTPSVTNTPSGTTATYTISVANAPGRDTARQVVLSDTLPTGFTYASTGAVTLEGGATQAVVVNPAAGAGAPAWSEFTIPGGASVSITFTVAVASTVSSSTLQNPALATYLDPARTTANGTVTASYDPSSSTAEDVRVTWPDLTIAKGHSGSFSRGGSHTYSLTVTNSGDAVSSGSVTLTDVLPAGLTPTLAQGTGWTCGIVVQTVTCSRSDGLSAGLAYPIVTVTVAVAQSAASSVTNTATIVGGNEQVTGNNSASDPTVIVDSADLSITKASSPSSYIPGGQIIYAVVITNNGPADVVGGAVTDTLPPSVTAATWTCVVAVGDGSCASPSGSGDIATTVDLVSGKTATLTITGTVANGTVGAISNTATVATPAGVNDPVPGNNSATDTNPTLATADLAVTKTSAPDPYVAGGQIVYTVTVTNNGPTGVVGAPFADTVPSQITGVSWTCAVAGSGACGSSAGSGSSISTTLDLANGASATFTISGTVDPGTVGPISNTASVSTPSGVADPSPGNNSATNDNPAGSVQADPQIGITPATSSGSVGSTTTFVINVKNNGPSAAQNVEAVIAAPSSFSGLSANGSGWSCSVALTTITCDFVGPLGTGTTAPPITAQAILPGTSGGYAVSATVTSSTPDTNGSNNSATASVTVGGAQPPVAASADLSLTKTTSQTAVMTGDQISYSVAVHNDGPNAAAAVSVTDSLPAELELVSATGDGWTCSSAGASITCTRAQLATGATSTVTIVVAATRGGTIANSATVTAGTADPVISNNVGSAFVRIARRVDLAVSKTVSAPTFVDGKRIAFTVVVRNNGPDDVEGVRVRDLVPTALADFRWTCSAVLAECADLSGVGSVVQDVSISVGGRVIYRLTGLVPRESPPTITNRVTAAPPVDAIDTDLSNNAATARVRMGLAPTTLRVTVTPGVATVTSGEPKRFVIRTSNTGTAAARGVVTCVSIPRGASVARATGGFVVAGRYCWQAPSLAAGKTVQYVIHVVGDRRQTRVVVLGVRAEARNAPGVRAAARVSVLTAVSSTAGGYTG